MHQIKENAGVVVAAETQAMVTAIDNAMLTQARLCSSVVEAASDAKMPVAATQKLLQSISDGMGSLVTTRANLSTAVKEMALIKSRSNLQPMNWGCPEDWKPSGEVKSDQIRAQEAA